MAQRDSNCPQQWNRTSPHFLGWSMVPGSALGRSCLVCKRPTVNMSHAGMRSWDHLPWSCSYDMCHEYGMFQVLSVTGSAGFTAVYAQEETIS